MLKQRIRDHWEAHDHERHHRPDRVNWWQSRMIREHINRIVCGEPHPAASGGLMRRAQQLLDGRTLKTGVSVGSAAGLKEMRLIQHGIVERFVLYELSTERVHRGRRNAERRGLEERVTFRNEDPFDTELDEQFDLVHWNNSLHHMLDVDAAVKWSLAVLKPGGLFLMDDYVGPNRFQWADSTLQLANAVRESLPEKYFANPFNEHRDRPLSRTVRRPNPRKLAKEDPSEAARSEQILPSVQKHFPSAEIIPTGGVIYQLALNHIIHNFDEGDEDDRTLLSALLVLDEHATRGPSVGTHYAVAVAFHDR